MKREHKILSFLSSQILIYEKSGRSSFGRVIAFQAIGSGFEARRPLNKKDLEESGSFIFIWCGGMGVEWEWNGEPNEPKASVQ